MKLTGIGEFKSINKFVCDKIRRFELTDRSFESLFGFVFGENDNVMLERTDGYRIEKITYGEIKNRIYASAPLVSQLLLKAGSGKTVGVYMQNSAEWFVVFWSLLMSGYAPLLINTRLDNATLEGFLGEYGINCVISDSSTLDGVINLKVTDVLADCGSEVPCDFTPHWEDSIMLMSSGTSEKLKMCVYTGKCFYYQILDSYKIISECSSIKRYYNGELKLLTFLPFYHIFGLAAVYMWFSFFSRTFVLLRNYSPDVIVNTVRKHKVTHVFAVPLLWNRIYDKAMCTIRSKGSKTYRKFDRAIKVAYSLRGIRLFDNLFIKLAFSEVRQKIFGDSICFLISGGGAIGGDVLKFFNCIGYHLANGYGMTEVGIASVELSDDIGKLCDSSVGAPFRSVEYKLTDDGELLLRSKSMATAIYCGGEELKHDRDSFYHTGDLASVVEGRLFIAGRKDDLIICENGENLNPYIVEGAIQIKGVSAACIVPLSAADGIRPTLVLSCAKYLSRDSLCSVRLQAERALQSMRLSATVPNIVLTSDAIILADDFKVNRRTVKYKLENGILNIADVEKSSDSSSGCDSLTSEIIRAFSASLAKNENEIGIDKNFFYDLGGTSLAYFAMVSGLEDEFGMPFSATEARPLYTVAQIVEYINDMQIS